MKIKNIKLKNYRNYYALDISFNDNLNIIIGENAQGKTNLLESIYVLAVTKSFLSASDRNLIKFNSKFSFINGLVEKKDCLTNLEILVNDNGKVVKINGKEIKKLSEYISRVNVIVFSAESIRMLKESPTSRRKYFNIQISQINRNYIKKLSDYNNILRQRNEYLKIINGNKKSDQEYLDILNTKYAELSVDVYEYRKNYILEINKYLDRIFKSIVGDELHLKLNYSCNFISGEKEYSLKDNLLWKLKDNFTKELSYKMTLFGPNRDDFYFTLEDKNLSLFGSQGQMRSAILALKLAEVLLFNTKIGETPVLLLDDVFSELDINKRNNILKYLDKKVQTILTTTDIENISEERRKNANVYVIKNGKIISREIIFKQEGDVNE